MGFGNVKKVEQKIMKEERRFIVKCDLCKTTIKTNATFVESVQGGVCPKCKEVSGY